MAEIESIQYDYVTPYTDMVKYLKVLYQDLNVLHHNITGAEFFSNHENLAEMYEDVSKIIDNLIELGMTIGILEPSIQDSLNFKSSIDVRLRNYHDTFEIVSNEMAVAIDYMEKAKNGVPDDIKNKIEEHEHTLRIWGLYKAKMLLQVTE